MLALDMTDGCSVDRALASAEERASGVLDVVINDPGQMFICLAEAFSPEEPSRQPDVNPVGPHRVIRAALPAMRERREGLVESQAGGARPARWSARTPASGS